MKVGALAAIGLVSGHFQAAHVRPEAGLTRSEDGVALTVGASYRPVGESAEFQRLVATQLSTGIGAVLLAHAAPGPTRVGVDSAGDVSIQVELASLTLARGPSYLDANIDELAASLLAGDDELIGLVEEIAGPDVALAVRVGIVLAGVSDEVAMAETIAALYSDPTVRAAAASAAAAGISAGAILADAAYARRNEVGKALRQLAVSVGNHLSGSAVSPGPLGSLLALDADKIERLRLLSTTTVAELTHRAGAGVGAVQTQAARWVDEQRRALQGTAERTGGAFQRDAERLTRVGVAAASEGWDRARTAGRELYGEESERLRQDADRAQAAAREAFIESQHRARAQAEQLRAATSQRVQTAQDQMRGQVGEMREGLGQTAGRIGGMLRRGP